MVLLVCICVVLLVLAAAAAVLVVQMATIRSQFTALMAAHMVEVAAAPKQTQALAEPAVLVPFVSFGPALLGRSHLLVQGIYDGKFLY